MNLLNYLLQELYHLSSYDPFGLKMISNTDDVMEIKQLLKNNINFYNPDMEMIDKYKRAFKIFQKNPQVYEHFFKILKVLPINSVNGRVFIIGFKKSTPEVDNSQLIVKVPLKGGDSLSYEYYIGNVINTLRENAKTPNFSLIYGRMMCGLNTIFEKKYKDESGNENFVQIPQKLLDNERVKICDSNYKDNMKMHLLYEYVRNPNTKRVSSFESYIDRLLNVDNETAMFILERNIINILIILMYSLQVAYDSVQFTHYDLHPGNILIVELDEPEEFVIKYKRGKTITIVSNVIPYVIDYGRCFVNPELAVPEEDGMFHEFETGHTYKNFSEFQKDLFGGMVYEYDESNPDNKESVSVLKLDKMVDNYLNKIKKLYNYSEDKINKMKIQIIDTILNRHTSQAGIKNYFTRKGSERVTLSRYDFGLNPKPNEKYDFFRLVKTVIDILYEGKETNDNLKYDKMWILLDNQLTIEYPFYDNVYYSLPCDYHITDYNSITTRPGPWKHWIMKPSDIGRILYNIIQDDIYTRGNKTLRKHQIGGGSILNLDKNQKKYNERVNYINTEMNSKIKNKTKIISEDNLNNETSYKDDFVSGIKDVGPMYVTYVESDLMKRINAANIKDNQNKRQKD
jgi:hypothetical protein